MLKRRTNGPVNVAGTFYSLPSLCISYISTYIYNRTLISVKKIRINFKKRT